MRKDCRFRENLFNFEPPKAVDRPSYNAHIASPYRIKGWNGHFGYRFGVCFWDKRFSNSNICALAGHGPFQYKKSNLSKCFALNDTT